MNINHGENLDSLLRRIVGLRALMLTAEIKIFKNPDDSGECWRLTCISFAKCRNLSSLTSL